MYCFIAIHYDMCSLIYRPAPVAVEIGVQMAELPEQGALGLGVARVEFPQLGDEQVVEEMRAVFGVVGGRVFRSKAAPPLGTSSRDTNVRPMASA